LGDAARERRPPNAARTRHVPKRLIRSCLRNGLGNVTEDALVLLGLGPAAPAVPSPIPHRSVSVVYMLDRLNSP
jgi:hypothetical protein